MNDIVDVIVDRILERIHDALGYAEEDCDERPRDRREDADPEKLERDVRHELRVLVAAAAAILSPPPQWLLGNEVGWLWRIELLQSFERQLPLVPVEPADPANPGRLS